MTRAVWQISGGPASRAYAEVFLKHGVALLGPGDAGPWSPERADDDFEGGFGMEPWYMLRLDNAFSAPCPKGSEEKRSIDAMPLPVSR